MSKPKKKQAFFMGEEITSKLNLARKRDIIFRRLQTFNLHGPQRTEMMHRGNKKKIIPIYKPKSNRLSKTQYKS